MLIPAVRGVFSTKKKSYTHLKPRQQSERAVFNVFQVTNARRSGGLGLLKHTKPAYIFLAFSGIFFSFYRDICREKERNIGIWKYIERDRNTKIQQQPRETTRSSLRSPSKDSSVMLLLLARCTRIDASRPNEILCADPHTGASQAPVGSPK